MSSVWTETTPVYRVHQHVILMYGVLYYPRALLLNICTTVQEYDRATEQKRGIKLYKVNCSEHVNWYIFLLVFKFVLENYSCHLFTTGKFDDTLVRHQVKYLGLMEHLRVRRAGFAYRRKYETFLDR